MRGGALLGPWFLGLWLLASGGLARADEPGEWEREAGPEVFYASPTDAAGHPTHVVLRVVDDLTGDPLPGATAALHAQEEYPVTGLAPHDRIGVADEDGWIRIRADDLGWTPTWVGAYWVYVEAPGHSGATEDALAGDLEIRLPRARSALVEVRDPLDRPVSGATVGVRVCTTCGHMPDQRIAVTGLDGRAVLPGLSAPTPTRRAVYGWETWVLHERLEGDYDELEVPARGDRPQVLRCRPSHPVEGAVTGADGKPVVGAHVGTYGMHRGPWTTTDAEGRFRLIGARPGLEVHVIPRDRDVGRDAPPTPRFRAPPAGFRRVFRIPAEGSPEEAPERFDVAVVLRDAAGKEAIEEDGVPLVAVRDGDGRTVGGEDEGIERLPAGAWTVLAGGHLSAWAPARARVEVGPAAPATVTIDLVRNPVVRVAFEGDPKGVGVTLVSAEDERPLDPEVLAKGEVPVPDGVECAFRIDVAAAGGRARTAFVRIPAARGPGTPPILLRPPAGRVVSARLTDPDGTPLAGWLLESTGDLGRSRYEEWEPPSAAADDPTLGVDGTGDVEVLAVAEDRAFAPRVVRVRVPDDAPDGARVDAGDVRLPRRGDRRLTVLGPDGSPAAGATVRVLPEDSGDAGLVPEDGVLDPRLLPFAAGDVVEIDWNARDGRSFVRPLRRVLEGDGPWTIRWDLPGTSVVLHATDEEGRPIDALLVVDGRAFPAPAATGEDGKPLPFEVLGLASGPHRIAVAAPDRLTRVFRVVLREGDRRPLAARLRPAPPAR